MKKLLHERLYAAAEDYIRTGNVCHIDVCGKPIYMPSNLANALADEIEKYYIPRPRFEDGEPVQFGDRFVNFRGEENSTISSLTYTKGNNDYVNINGWNKQNLNEPVHRCKPKILDAYGDETKVGDVVWPINNPEMKMTVDNFQQIYGQDATVNCEFEGEFYNFNPDKLTHREPDSLEKLRDDIDMYVRNGWNISQPKAEEFANRLTAIMERDA